MVDHFENGTKSKMPAEIAPTLSHAIFSNEIFFIILLSIRSYQAIQFSVWKSCNWRSLWYPNLEFYTTKHLNFFDGKTCEILYLLIALLLNLWIFFTAKPLMFFSYLSQDVRLVTTLMLKSMVSLSHILNSRTRPRPWFLLTNIPIDW